MRAYIMALLFVASAIFNVVMMAAPVHVAKKVFTITYGRVVATEQENIECYFSVGSHTMLVLHQNGEPCVLVRQELLGKSVQLMAVVED